MWARIALAIDPMAACHQRLVILILFLVHASVQCGRHYCMIEIGGPCCGTVTSRLIRLIYGCQVRERTAFRKDRIFALFIKFEFVCYRRITGLFEFPVRAISLQSEHVYVYSISVSQSDRYMSKQPLNNNVAARTWSCNGRIRRHPPSGASNDV